MFARANYLKSKYSKRYFVCARLEAKKITTVVISPILPKFYDYTIDQYVIRNGSLQSYGTPSNRTIGALEIELQTINHWWIYLAANYHDSFYYTSFNSTRAIPTQVTGAVGESLALVIMQRLYRARNIRRIIPHPSSKTADFEMDIHLNRRMVHALVESKGSNINRNYPPLQTVYQGASQLFATRRAHPSRAGYLVITSYPARRCFVIRVF